MHIDLWTLGLQTINLLVLVWILSKFLFKPVARAIADRQAAAAKLLDDAQDAQASAHAEQEKAAQLRQQLAKTRSDILQTASDAAEKHNAELLANGQAEVAKMRSDAREDIAHLQEKAQVRRNREAAQLAVSIAEKLLDRLPDSARTVNFADGLAHGLATLAPPSLAELRAATGPLTIKAARPLSDTEKSACRAALSSVLGTAATFEFTVEPGLIAGLALETPHIVVTNNLRADLDRIAQAMTNAEKE